MMAGLILLLVAFPDEARIPPEEWPADAAQARPLHTAHCATGEVLHCYALAFLEFNENGDLPLAREKAELACTGTAGAACNLLGLMRMEGKGGDVDMPGAIGAFSAGCRLSDGDACNSLAILQYSGQGMTPDKASAVANFRKDCDHNSAGACYNIGQLHKAGDGVPQNLATARNDFTTACRLGNQQACAEVQ